MSTILDKFRSKQASVKEEKPEITSETNVCENPTCEESDATTLKGSEVSECENNTETEPKVASVPKEQPKRSTIRVCKMGSDHNFANMNNQDFAFYLPNMKIVLDGCGSEDHSEVGTKLFGQLFARKAKEYFYKGESICEDNFIEVVNSIFEKMLELCNDSSFISKNYHFTILVCFETEDEFVVYSCGDGYIVKENEEGISFDRLDDGEYPCYYIYNFITDKSSLVKYKDGVSFKVTRFAKNDYFNVGVASDGLRYAENLSKIENNNLMKFLHEGIGPKIEKLINRNNRNNEMFHDDISICF